MRNHFRKSTPITRQLVPQDQRSIVISQLFGFSFDLESIVRGFILSMAKDYRPGPLLLYKLSNNGCYLKPSTDQTYAVTCENGWSHGVMTADAVGAVATLTGLNYQSFTINLDQADSYEDMRLKLREYALEHDEAANILAATR
jgi:hypothetical protein